MGELLEFKAKASSRKNKLSAPKGKRTKKVIPESKAEAAPKKPAEKKSKAPVNAESIKLWWISQEFDDLIRKAVIEKHIPTEELAAVMAHRLGTLLMVSERTPEMALFCMKIISKITNQPHPGSNAS